MDSARRNTYLDAGLSDESDHDTGYDSEAAEVSKAGRATKRRKVEHDYTDQEEDNDNLSPPRYTQPMAALPTTVAAQAEQKSQEEEDDIGGKSQDESEENEASDKQSLYPESTDQQPLPISTAEPPTQKKKKTKHKEEPTPGVIYLSSLPPYLKPSALRNLLEQRGFTPIVRIFLSPASKSNKSHSSRGKNSRQLYSEGWIEFSSKKTAKSCAETLNASTVGGKKRGYYRDDVWNMKYLSGMRWEELMAGVREEKREMEGRRDEERRVIAREAKIFVEGVEEGRRREGMRKKREKKRGRDAEEGDEKEGDMKRTWRQNEVKGKKKGQDAGNAKISDDVRQVLGKIF